ncbi:MAG: hypothetical protein D6732_10385 [Methanobacteriota archaeon]|nr:MAG: hypothetical protein D6732_10385 [Euryarchaeota archaeon]
MTRRTISLADGVDLIIDEPSAAKPSDRAALIASAVINEFESGSNYLRANKSGEFKFKIGHSIFRIYYQYKVNRVLSKLEAYNAAIQYIENNMYQFDYRLARKAIDVLRQCFRDDLK